MSHVLIHERPGGSFLVALTGGAYDVLKEQRNFRLLLKHVVVFARMSPDQKAQVVGWLKGGSPDEPNVGHVGESSRGTSISGGSPRVQWLPAKPTAAVGMYQQQMVTTDGYPHVLQDISYDLPPARLLVE